MYICKKTSSAITDSFDELYPALNELILKEKAVDSRNGNTFEKLDFKTIISNPIARCVGTHNRDINIFFLLAEAIWIWAGKSDVKFLEIFNSRMADFSDNGKTFHAPYGFRMRNYGVESNSLKEDSNRHAFNGLDQLRIAIEMLEKDETNRRVVISIWNPDFDLAIDSKDIPCNDLIMLKIREGKLNMTIQNRSNDLHWGLPTNVFQFSWILELMAEVLRVDVGKQVHNSQSLHIYESNPIAGRMNESKNKRAFYHRVIPSRMNLNLNGQFAATRLKEVDAAMEYMIAYLTSTKTGNFRSKIHIPESYKQSKYLQQVLRILSIYVNYTNSNRSVNPKIEAFEALLGEFAESDGMCEDYYVLAMNWFASRIDSLELVSVLTKHSFLEQYETLGIGKL